MYLYSIFVYINTIIYIIQKKLQYNTYTLMWVAFCFEELLGFHMVIVHPVKILPHIEIFLSLSWLRSQIPTLQLQLAHIAQKVVCIKKIKFFVIVLPLLATIWSFSETKNDFSKKVTTLTNIPKYIRYTFWRNTNIQLIEGKLEDVILFQDAKFQMPPEITHFSYLISHKK